ncbi:MAG TPA: GNAT family N-acetyltransferase [Deltaproteobacteria bacterium]|nr:GNAT family N-acetyltransferase [Deltaproteobacteria bacterium]HPR53941.1 GNAT family N-acetyltransferase [Deltaproteobacteria bacterium]HXK46741.1 GNAT family N-acetyltransferase [Deltaproteobacteria bacterium]
MSIRHVLPSDYLPVISVLNEWWGGRNMSDMLPRLFFVHFQDTGFVVEHEERIVGFLVGFFSQTFADQAYIHFAGIHPGFRRKGLGRILYESFFDAAKENGRRVVKSVTSPANKASIAFHLAMGFQVDKADTVVDGISVSGAYDGPGGDRVLFSRKLE